LSLTARIAPFVSVVMILIMTSSELTRYACGEWAITVNLEQENEEPTDTESKTEGVDSSDEIIFTDYSASHYRLSSKQSFELCFPPQKPSYGVCKIHLEPPDTRLNT
jgi:hypothetical protein